MQAFASLLERLVLTPSRNAKLQLICDYLRHTTDPSRGWALAAITGDLDIPSVKPAAIRELVASRVDPVLFNLSYDYVGDLAETISLIWPQRPGANRAPDLNEIVETLLESTKAQGLKLVEGWLDALDSTGRWGLLKLITGGLRVGVSARLARQAVADFGPAEGGKVDVAEIEELWHGMKPPYLDLFAWLEGKGPKPVSGALAPFRPPMLAHPLLSKAERMEAADLDPSLISPKDFAAEWKWDGVRVQLAADQGVRRLYTRNGDDISKAFPDLLETVDFNATLDGELLIRSPEGGVASFNELQQRMNRKTVSPKQMADRPAMLRAYDLLNENGEDLRPLPFVDRRKCLERFVVSLHNESIDLSPLVPFDDAIQLEDTRRNPPTREIEGLMLKRWDAPYLAGRPAGLWYKWKRDPMLIDAVLMYAQRGHGKRSSFYSDFTFGVWRATPEGDELAPVGKAYFGFTDEELVMLDKYVRDHTYERYGPVRSVTANKKEGLVLEVAFEGLQKSSRHKSGVAMRFPRIHRIRWDKPSRDADRMETLEALLAI
ncbi:MAG TPA: cisplatin damage response ATP-dependent DNA ligase [Hyphomonadaceae bacterium]|nr:cisplatin damage response ATP-dependent DNA ligase [Hyphomonadaceae bacterium]HPN04496.1 cisplatin damage response ATP-dependent DNA ligase [Hyphomonadaceae bacterium]